MSPVLIVLIYEIKNLQIIDKNGVNRFAEIAPLPGFSKETFAQVKQEMIQMYFLFTETCGA